MPKHPMSRRLVWRTLAVIFIASVAVAFAWQWLRGDAGAVDVSGLAREHQQWSVPVDLDDLASGRPPAPVRATGARMVPAVFDPAVAATPMVMPEMPVGEMLELLGPRARSGDPVAACELGRALGQCRMRSSTGRMSMPSPPVDALQSALDDYVNFEAARQEWSEHLEQRCDGIDSAALSEGLTFTARAAVNGHLPSLLDFIDAPASAAGDFIRSPALGDAYRSQVWPLLQRAFAQGNLEVAIVAMTHLSTQQAGSPLSAVVPPQYQDPEAARALLGMLRAGTTAKPHKPLFDPDPPSAQAVVAAQRWVDELFDAQLPANEFTSMRMAWSCRDAANWLGHTSP